MTIEANESSLEDLGIDSFVINEMTTEVAKNYVVKIDTHNFENSPNIKSLCDLILDLRVANNDDACDIENDDKSSFILTMRSLLHQTLNAPRYQIRKS